MKATGFIVLSGCLACAGLLLSTLSRRETLVKPPDPTIVQPMIASAPAASEAQPAKAGPPAGVSPSEWEGVVAQIRAEQRAFQTSADQHVHAVSAQGERLELAPDGAATVSLHTAPGPVDTRGSKDPVIRSATVGAAGGPAVTLSLRSTGLGREGNAKAVSTAPVKAVGKQVADRSLGNGITEWWRSEERGFEFGWNLGGKPSGDGPLRLTMAVDCPWPGTVDPGGLGVSFSDPAGSGWRLACRELVALDATGRSLPARMELAGNTLTFQVDDAGAQYPLVVDPWIVAEAPVIVNAPVPDADQSFGSSAVLSGDTLVVTSVEVHSVLSVQIFTRSGSGYLLRRSVPFFFPSMLTFNGHAAAVCGDTVVAGPFLSPIPIPGGNDFFYAAFERNAGGSNAWASVQEFHYTGSDQDLHASSIALGPDTLALGFPGVKSLQENERVKLYRRDPANLSMWVAGGAVNGMDMTGVSHFGLTINMDGPTMAIGSVFQNSALVLSIFRSSGAQWQFEQQFAPPGLFQAGLPAISLSGNTLAVGIGTLTSEVRLYERDSGGPGQWGLVRTLTGPVNSLFGKAVGLEGDLLVVGSPEEDIDHDGNSATPAISGAGAVRSYGRHTGGYNMWGQTGIIHKALAAKANGSYGGVLSVNCGRLAVGYPHGDSVSPVVVDAGVVEIYSAFSGTNFRFTVDMPISANGTDFGTAVALDGPYLLVGAPVYDPAVPNAASGAAFLFRDRVLVKTWFGQSPGDFFGQAVAIERDRVAIGAPRRAGTSGGTPFDDLGAVYIYERNKGGAENWGNTKVLVPAAVATSPSPLFGSVVALSGDSIAVGSPFETSLVFPGPAGTGRARIFDRNQGGADNWGQAGFLYGADTGASESFGTALDLSGDTLVVGAPLETANTQVVAGGAYVFRRNQGGADKWGRVVRLTAPNPATGAEFGWSVALDGNDLAIGAIREARGSVAAAGAVYLFSTGSPNYDLWTFASRLQPDELILNHNFGQSLGLSQGRVIIGAPNASAPEPSAAAVWLYNKTNRAGAIWELEGKFITAAPDSAGAAVAIDGRHFVAGDPMDDVIIGGTLQVNRGVVHDWVQLGMEWAPLRSRTGDAGTAELGSSIALLNEMMVTGAPGEPAGGRSQAGAVYVFRKGDLRQGGWQLDQRLTDPAGDTVNARFGASMSMDSQWLAVGSPGAHRVGLFTRGAALSPARPWTGSGSLTVSPVQADQCGASVAMADGRLIAGAPQRTGGGAAVLFERNAGGSNAWGQVRILTGSDTAAGDAFGSAVALNAGVAVVGAPMDDHAGGTDAGGVYVFSRNTGGGDAWGQVKKLTLPTQAAGDELGSSVALADYLVLAGMPGDDTAAGTNAGSALLFARNFGGAENYGLIKTFMPADSASQARCGTAVALDTSHAIVTSPYADPGGRTNAGEIHIYSRNYGGVDTWGLLQVSSPMELPVASQFGMAAAIDHNTFAVGAPLAPAGQAQGIVEIYTFRGRTLYDEWTASWGLTGSDADPMADADGDGQENILELHFGTDPGDQRSSGTVGLRVSGSHLIVTFPRACPCENTGVLTGEVTSDLLTWTPATPAMILTDNAALLQLQIPLVPGQKKFVRFRVDLP